MTELRDINQSLPIRLLQARETAMAYFRPMLREHELTDAQWRVLRALAASPGLEVGELAIQTALLGPSLTRILQFLGDQQWITRETLAEDQRRSVIRLSARGRDKYLSVGPDAESLYQTIESSFGKRKLKALYGLLDELEDALGSNAYDSHADGASTGSNLRDTAAVTATCSTHRKNKA